MLAHLFAGKKSVSPGGETVSTDRPPVQVLTTRPIEPGVVRLHPDDRLILVLERPLTDEARWRTESALLDLLARKDQAIVLDGTCAQLYVLRRE